MTAAPQPLKSDRYRASAISLHWLIAILIFGGYALGLFMHDLPASPDKLRYYSWHKWIGVTVFLLALLRAIWRMTHPAPPLVAGRRWEHAAAHVTHFLLYLLMFAIPLSGWLYSSAAGYQTVYLGLVPLPDLLAKNESLADRLADVHEWLNCALLLLLLLHALAALHHHYLRGDATLRRMLPQRGAGFWVLVATLFAVLALGVTGTQRVSDLLEDSGDEHHHHDHDDDDQGDDEAHAPAASAASSAGDDAAAPIAVSGEIVAEFRQENVPVQGRFTGVHASRLQFDPAHLEQAQADITVDTASFDIGDADYNAEVRKKEWFDSAEFPQAHFVSTSVTSAIDGKFQASGALTIKNKTVPATVVFTRSADGDALRYDGDLKVSRAAYGIGDAQWNGVLDDSVIVRFKLSVPHG